MTLLELNFLGTAEVRLDGKTVSGFESDKSRLLLAYLAIESNRPHRREFLAGLFWPESSEKRARQSLSQALYNIRQLVCMEQVVDCLKVTSKDVCFSLGSEVKLDVSCFLKLSQEIYTHDHFAAWACRFCQEGLEKAYVLYRGELLTGFSLPDAVEFEEWLLNQREYLHAKQLKVLQELVSSYMKRGDIDKALVYAENLVAMDRLDEANYRQWLALLAQSGRRTKALKEYAEFRRLLFDELGVEPEGDTVSLFEKLQREPEKDTSSNHESHNLPAAVTPLVGRDKELDDLYWRVIDPGYRLVTILGMGGFGKTRLALEAGRCLLPAFPDGVYLVELGVLTSPLDLLPAITRTLGVKPKKMQDEPQKTGQEQLLVDYLREKQLLLILDSAEMVLEGAHGISDLLLSAPGLKVLATSRTRLGLTAETLFQLEGLSFPDKIIDGWDDYPAVRLFLDAARRSKPDFILSDQNVPAVHQICLTLQGMPLAILLAAAWVSAMPPEKISHEIQDNLDFLAVAWKDLPSRQKSLRATFDYSWGLLWDEERSVLRKLAIFLQPFTDEQAKQVALATANTLKALLDFSLIQRTGQNRLRLHDLVRQFARDKLIEVPEESLATHHRLASLYSRMVIQWNSDLKTNQMVRALNVMDMEIENVRYAWDWMIKQRNTNGLFEIHEGLCNYYDRRGLYQHGESTCEKALVLVEEERVVNENVRIWARLSAWLGYFKIARGQKDEGLSWLEEVVKFLDDSAWQDFDTRWEKALALFFMLIAHVRHDNETAILCATQSADLFLQCDERWYAARALAFAGAALESMGRYIEQISTAERALSLLSADGDPELVRYINYVLGCGYIYSGDLEKGIQLIELSLPASSGSEEKEEIAKISIARAVSFIFQGNYPEALPYIQLGFNIHQELARPFGDENYIRYQSVFWGLGMYDSVIELQPEITGVYGQSLSVSIGMVYLLHGAVDLALKILEESRKAAIETTNLRLMGIINALLSIACYQNHQRDRAARLLLEGLEKSRSGNTVEMSANLIAVAYYLLEQGELGKAIEVYTVALKNPFFGKSAWLHDFLGTRIDRLTSSMPVEEVEAFRRLGREQELLFKVEEYLENFNQLTVLI